jgi:hypothetical protein
VREDDYRYDAQFPEANEVAQPMIANDGPLQESGVNASQPHYHHNLSSILRRDYTHRSSNNDLESSNFVSSDSPAPDRLPSRQIPREQAPRHPRKDKRVRKRDTRHSRNSTGVASDTGLPKATSSRDLDAQTSLSKKAKIRHPNLAATTEAANARVESSPPPPLPRDPALDLVPGFESDKACAA